MKIRTKSFNKNLKRHIYDGRITSFFEINDETSIYPYHKERVFGDSIYPAWEYEFFRHGITEKEKFFCYAKSSNERDSLKEIGIRSDYTVAISIYKKNEVLKISTKDMYRYPREKELTEFYIQIKSAECIIVENTFWWKYEFEKIEKPENFMS